MMRLPKGIEAFADRLDIFDGTLHLATCAGLGDLAWTLSKFWYVKEVGGRRIKLWFPENERQRAGQLAQLCGYEYGYLPNLSSRMVWEHSDAHGDPEIPDSGGVLVVSTNRHLEAGRRIEKWYPDLPFRNPVELLKESDLHRPYRLDIGHGSYVIVFMGNATYMGGQLMPAQWGRVLKMIEVDIAPCLCVAFGPNSQSFLVDVSRYFMPSLPPLLGTPLAEVLPWIKEARACVGTASGYTILSTYMGLPTVHAYPRWLKAMPGTWEQEGAKSDWCFLDQLENAVRDRFVVDAIVKGEARDVSPGGYDATSGDVAQDQEQMPFGDDTAYRLYLQKAAGKVDGGAGHELHAGLSVLSE